MIAILRTTLSCKWKWIFRNVKFQLKKIQLILCFQCSTTTQPPLPSQLQRVRLISETRKLQVGKWLLNKDACTGPGKVLQPIKKDAETGGNMSDPSQKILAMKVSPQTQLTGHHCWRKPKVILAWRHYVVHANKWSPLSKQCQYNWPLWPLKCQG